MVNMSKQEEIFLNQTNCDIIFIIVKFMQDEQKYSKRRAKISADISARVSRLAIVYCYNNRRR